MTQGQNTTLCLLVAGLAIASTARAATADSSKNPYQVIVDNNVFRLKPPPPPPSEEPPKLPTPKITLTGITTFGKTRAMLKTPPPPAKPGEPPKGEQFYTLAVGERDGEMEMVEIDVVAGSVKVKYAGNEVPLNFVDNGAKPTTAPALPTPGQPGLPGQPGGFVPPPPTGNPAIQPAMSGARPLPTRTLRLPTPAGGTSSYNPGGAYNQAAMAGGYVPPVNNVQVSTPGGMQTLPSFNFNPGGPAGNAGPAVPTQQQEQLTAEQQMVIMEVQRSMPGLPPVPPTPLSPQPVQQLVPPPPVPKGI